MEYQNITNLLDNIPDKVPRFITRKWIEVHDQSGTAENRYKSGKQIRFKTSLLRSDLCDYSDPYIVVDGEITVSRGGYDTYDLLVPFQKSIIHLFIMQKI